jgi:hypothetical protein
MRGTIHSDAERWETVMITLDIQPYCHNCPNFKAKVDHINREVGPGEREYHHVIFCEHQFTCHSIKEYLARQERESGK